MTHRLVFTRGNLSFDSCQIVEISVLAAKSKLLKRTEYENSDDNIFIFKKTFSHKLTKRKVYQLNKDTKTRAEWRRQVNYITRVD